MTHLSKMIKSAFSASKCRQSCYALGSWNLAFVDRTWDTFFILFYNKTRVLSGNTSDKVLIAHTEEEILVKSAAAGFAEAAPDYTLKM